MRPNTAAGRSQRVLQTVCMWRRAAGLYCIDSPNNNILTKLDSYYKAAVILRRKTVTAQVFNHMGRRNDIILLLTEPFSIGRSRGQNKYLFWDNQINDLKTM